MTSSSCFTAAVTSICCSSSDCDMPHGLRPHKFLAKDPMSRFLTIYFDQVQDEFLKMALGKLDSGQLGFRIPMSPRDSPSEWLGPRSQLFRAQLSGAQFVRTLVEDPKFRFQDLRSQSSQFDQGWAGSKMTSSSSFSAGGLFIVLLLTWQGHLTSSCAAIDQR